MNYNQRKMSYNPYEIRLNGKLRKLGRGAQGMVRNEGMRVASRKVGWQKLWGVEKFGDMVKL